MTYFVDQFPYVGRQIAGETQRAPGHRMDEPQNRRVERLPMKTQCLENRPHLRRRASISWISQ